MDDTIISVIKGAAIIASIAVLIALAATYWYIWVGLGIVIFIAMKAYSKQKDERNKV